MHVVSRIKTVAMSLGGMVADILTASKATARSRRASNRAPSNQSSDAACAMVEDSDDSENESLKPLKELSKTKKPGDVSTFGGAGGTVGGRPEDMMLMIGLVARPASIQLQELSSQIKRLSRIGQGAGSVVYTGLWTGVPVAIKFMLSETPDKLHQPGGGVVYKGLWTGVPVAIKFMLSETPDKLHQPAREAILSRYVSHPNVVQTYTYDVTMLVESSTGAAALSPDTPLKQMLPNTNTNGSKASPALKTIPSVECSEASMPMSGVTGASGPPNLGGNRLAGLPSDRLIPSGAALLPRAAYLGTANSLNIFDLGSQSTVDIHGSLKPGSDESDDENGNEGWKMSDVLLRLGATPGQLGATPGQYLTHIILELCDAGTLITAISGDMFSASKDPAERGKVKAMLRTAREIAHGMVGAAPPFGVAALHLIFSPLALVAVASQLAVHLNIIPACEAEDAGDIRGFVSKVADFGLARRLETAEPLEESSGEPIGTLSYMAPEAMKGTLQKGSDVYSFGIILWQFCTGLTPYKGLHHAHIYYGKKNGSLTLSWPAETYSPVRRLAEIGHVHKRVIVRDDAGVERPKSGGGLGGQRAISFPPLRANARP
eukprot:gene21894-28933_t